MRPVQPARSARPKCGQLFDLGTAQSVRQQQGAVEVDARARRGFDSGKADPAENAGVLSRNAIGATARYFSRDPKFLKSNYKFLIFNYKIFLLTDDD